MIKDAIEYIASLGQSSQAIRTVPISDHKQMVFLPDGTSSIVVSDFPALSRSTNNVESFIASANSYGSELTVWLNTVSAIAICDDDEYRENLLTLNLQSSDEFKAVTELPMEFSQRQLVRFLKRNFSLDTSLISALKRVDFRRTSDGSKSIEHGKESLGRSVEAEVQSAEEIPESTVIEIPRYSNAGLRERYPIELRIDIDLEAEKFWLGVGPNEVELFKQRALADVAQSLSEISGSVYVGNIL